MSSGTGGSTTAHPHVPQGAGKAQQRARRIVRPVANRLWDFQLEGFDRLPASGPKIECGVSLKRITISDIRARIRLPVRR